MIPLTHHPQALSAQAKLNHKYDRQGSGDIASILACGNSCLPATVTGEGEWSFCPLGGNSAGTASRRPAHRCGRRPIKRPKPGGRRHGRLCDLGLSAVSEGREIIMFARNHGKFIATAGLLPSHIAHILGWSYSKKKQRETMSITTSGDSLAPPRDKVERRPAMGVGLACLLAFSIVAWVLLCYAAFAVFG
jgi:hypothetical protein